MNPYQVLGVDTNATFKEVTKAYYTLAQLWHPDKNKSPEAEQKFKEISNAYQVLNKRRQKYFLDISYQDLINGTEGEISFDGLETVLKIEPKSWSGRVIYIGNNKIVLRAKSNYNLKHKQYDLYYTYTLSLWQALLGLNTDLVICGQTFKIAYNKPINNRTIITFKNGGLYNSKGYRGKLYIKFYIIYPQEITSEQRDYLTKFFLK